MTLHPLVWEAMESLAYDAAAHRLHRPGCAHLGATATAVARGERLRFMQAPAMCTTCRPRVAMRLGRQT